MVAGQPVARAGDRGAHRRPPGLGRRHRGLGPPANRHRTAGRAPNVIRQAPLDRPHPASSSADSNSTDPKLQGIITKSPHHSRCRSDALVGEHITLPRRAHQQRTDADRLALQLVSRSSPRLSPPAMRLTCRHRPRSYTRALAAASGANLESSSISRCCSQWRRTGQAQIRRHTRPCSGGHHYPLAAAFLCAHSMTGAGAGRLRRCGRTNHGASFAGTPAPHRAGPPRRTRGGPLGSSGQRGRGGDQRHHDARLIHGPSTEPLNITGRSSVAVSPSGQAVTAMVTAARPFGPGHRSPVLDVTTGNPADIATGRSCYSRPCPPMTRSCSSTAATARRGPTQMPASTAGEGHGCVHNYAPPSRPMAASSPTPIGASNLPLWRT